MICQDVCLKDPRDRLPEPKTGVPGRLPGQ